MSRSRVQLVCFDLGEVLIRLVGGWADACAAVGVDWPHGELDEAVRGQIRELVRRHETGVMDFERFTDALSKHVELPVEQVQRAICAWLSEPYPGVPELLESLAAAPVRTACLSNTNARHWSQMTTPGSPNHLPLDRLDYRFASHLIGHYKPDAAIYAHVEEATGLPGGAIVFFDNAPENVAAARERGWRAHRIDPAGDTVAQMRTHLSAYDLL